MYCLNCKKKLNISVYNDQGQKSCPKCSVKNGKIHVFYDESEFGFSDKRITKHNPKGIQSYCKTCRSHSW
ncbi:hypothetical protein MPAN_015660 [Mariniplasma anaerobium]|uniref:Uncharacterized protein n=1 Tax=Mariniplasma anaerobium TaxID=2735436 RepID=A0A7U9THN6_9MOLU|nr:hypothetical protein MPAN_015660 [Mariniplasma anaerobium]